MSLVDELKSGYKAGSWNQAPFYPSAVWTSKVILTGTPNITGLTFDCYARASEFTTERLFDIAVSEDSDNGSVVLFLKASEESTEKAIGCSQLVVTLQFTEDSTEETYPYFHGSVPVEVGVL